MGVGGPTGGFGGPTGGLVAPKELWWSLWCSHGVWWPYKGVGGPTGGFGGPTGGFGGHCGVPVRFGGPTRAFGDPKGSLVATVMSP